MRKINFRVLFYGVLAFAFALIFARHIFSIGYIIFALISFGSIFYLCLKYKKLKRFLFLSLMFVCGVLYFISSYCLFFQESYNDKTFVVGRISSVCNKTGYSLVVLDDVKINDENKTFNIVATVSNLSFNLGDIVVGELQLKNVELFNDNNFNSFYYKNNAPFKTSLNNSNCITKTGYKKLDEKAKINFNNFVNSYFQKDIANIISSVIIGDKLTLDTEIKEAFSVSGIGHLLAISGLHVGVIVLIINFILDKCKLNRKIKFIILFILLNFYCYICGYSPSVTRASLMSIVFMLAELCSQKYDKLNCLSFTALLILLIKPFYVFDAGFLLSYISVFCIFTIYQQFKKLFKTIKNKTIKNTLSLIVCVQISLLPIMALYYKTFNILSILTNLICVPLFEFSFILTFCLIPFCMLFPFLIFSLKFLEFLYFILIQIAHLISSTKFLNLSLTKIGGLFCVGVYTSCFIASNYVNLPNKQKLYSILTILCFGFLCSIFI